RARRRPGVRARRSVPAEMQVGFQQAQRAQNRMTLLFGGAVLVLVVLGGAFLLKMRGGGVLKEDEGTLIEASEGKPPAWINQEFFRDNDNIYFTGNSGFLPSKDDAINEASSAAVERAVHQLGVMVRNGKWIDQVLNQYQTQR